MNSYTRFSTLTAASLALTLAASLLLHHDTRLAHIDMPGFVMTREVTTPDTRAVFRLEWRNQLHWKDELVESSDPGAEAGAYKAVDGGVITNYVHGNAVEESPPPDVGITVPVVWFSDLDFALGRARDIERRGAGTYMLSDDGARKVLSLTTKLDTTVWTFDKATGIPLDYQQIVAGRVVLDQQAVSLVLLDGTVVR